MNCISSARRRSFPVLYIFVVTNCKNINDPVAGVGGVPFLDTRGAGGRREGLVLSPIHIQGLEL